MLSERHTTHVLAVVNAGIRHSYFPKPGKLAAYVISQQICQSHINWTLHWNSYQSVALFYSPPFACTLFKSHGTKMLINSTADKTAWSNLRPNPSSNPYEASLLQDFTLVRLRQDKLSIQHFPRRHQMLQYIKNLTVGCKIRQEIGTISFNSQLVLLQILQNHFPDHLGNLFSHMKKLRFGCSKWQSLEVGEEVHGAG